MPLSIGTIHVIDVRGKQLPALVNSLEGDNYNVTVFTPEGVMQLNNLTAEQLKASKKPAKAAVVEEEVEDEEDAAVVPVPLESPPSPPEDPPAPPPDVETAQFV
ncbi:MAG TPA: hypothetical protein VF077_06145, partial [Nitrospiraceae bacterium]